MSTKGRIKMPTRNYQDLIAWQKSMDLVAAVYELAKALPDSEQFGLATQLRRAVVSIPANIAEGQGRKSDREFCHYLSIAHGSLREVETEILIAIRLKYVSRACTESTMQLAAEIGRVVSGLRRALSKHTRSSC